jgi:multicomponent Na+:H+ antiporter subunit D
MNSLIPLFVIIPLGSAFVSAILGRFIKDFGKYFINLAMLFLLGLTIHLFLNNEGTLIYKVGGFANAGGIPIAIFMVVDGFSKILLLIISIIGFLVAFYSICYTSQYTAERKFYILFSLMLAGMYGMVLSGDIFNMYVFLEISSIASYALVAFGIEKQQLEASFKYQILGGVASMLILLGIGFLYWNTGTLNLADIASQISTNEILIKFIAVLMIVGFGLKAAIFPFHAWLPDAHSSAPSPISAMLSGVLIKAVGIYVLFRLFFNVFALNYDLALAITVLGTLSMIVGVLLAIGQWDMKRLLAYHSISQMGYVVVAVGIGMILLSTGGSKMIAGLSIFGGLYHLVNHSIFKSLLFLNAGAIEYRIGTRNLKKMGGLAKVMPITSSTNFIASMSISGIPPFNGFFSKLIIIIAAVQAQYYFIAAMAVMVSVVTLGSFLKIQKYAFYNKENEKWDKKKIKEAPFSMSFAMIILAVLCLAMSLLVIPSIRDIVMTPAVNALMETVQYSKTVIGF